MSNLDRAFALLTENRQDFVWKLWELSDHVVDENVPESRVIGATTRSGVPHLRFEFNKNLVDRATDERLAFEINHAGMHFLFNHPGMLPALTGVTTQEITSGQLSDEAKLKLSAYDLASDLIVNDYLARVGMELPKNARRGEDLLGYDCADSFLFDVYQSALVMLRSIPPPPDPSQTPSPSSAGGSSEGLGGQPSQSDQAPDPEMQSDGEGVSGQSEPDDLSDQDDAENDLDPDQLPQHDWQSSPIDAQQMNAAYEQFMKAAMPATNTKRVDTSMAILKEAAQRTQEDAEMIEQNLPSSGAGIGGDRKLEFAAKTGTKMDWVKLLARINPDMFESGDSLVRVVPSFHHRRRKLGAFPDLYLPVWQELDERGDDKEAKIPTLVMALDVSGSIGQDDVVAFVGLARSIPKDKINLKTMVFADRAAWVDLSSDHVRLPRVGGGTDFSPIERLIRSDIVPEFKKYPDSVVLITDGEGYFRNGMIPQQPASWLVLVSGSRSDINRIYSYHFGNSGIKKEQIEPVSQYVDLNQLRQQAKGVMAATYGSLY